MLEAYRVLGGHEPELLALEKSVVAALDARLHASATGLLATYPGETYVADNAVVLAVLALADLGRGAHASGMATAVKLPHGNLLAKTLASWRATLVDADTGVLVFGDGTRRQPRASGATLSAMMLAYVDGAFARDQATAITAHFDDRVFGLFAAVCEHPGCGGTGDVDSGPLLRGASPSATGFAIALAKRAGDEPRLDRLLATAEWAGAGASPEPTNNATSWRPSWVMRSCWRRRARATGTCATFIECARS